MFKITAVKDESYYQELVKAQGYYAEGGQIPGFWHDGKGCRAFGVKGQVKPKEFSNFFQGRSGDGSESNVRKGRKEHRPAFDFTFSAPKDVSTLWALSNRKDRRIIEKCHREAVAVALKLAEEELAFSRRGKGGAIREKAVGLLIARFTHTTNRERQPNLHEHAIVVNQCQRPDGTHGTLDATPFYRNQHLLGAIYMQALSYQLGQKLGPITERVYGEVVEQGEKRKVGQPWFGVKGVPEKLSDHWSKARKDLLAQCEEWGTFSAKARHVARLLTRSEKNTTLTDNDLRPLWLETGKAFGFGRNEVEALLSRAANQETTALDLEDVIDKATKRLSQSQAHYSRHEFLRMVCEEAISSGVSPALLQEKAAKSLNDPSRFAKRGEGGNVRYSTLDNLQVETELLTSAEALHQRRNHQVNDQTRNAVLSRKKWQTLSQEQKAAITHITGGSGISLVRGIAGSGKTFMLDCAREILEKGGGGYRVIGAAYTGKAAAGLKKDAHLETSTVHRLLKDLDSGILEDAKHHIRMLARAALGKKTWKQEKITLDPKTVLFVDESSMLDSMIMNRLLKHVERSGAAVVMVGDERQCQAILAGGPFKSFLHRFGFASLDEIRRQRLDHTDQDPEWRRKAVKDFAAGNASAALHAYKSRGFLTVAKDQKTTKDSLINDWAEKGGISNPEGHFILAQTRRDVAEMNKLAQEKRMESGQLGGFKARLKTDSLYLGTPHFNSAGYTIFENDRILFTRNDNWTRVCNGELATVLTIDQVKGTIVVRVDNKDKAITVSLKQYQRFGDSIQLGYAATTYKSQGASLEQSYVLCGADREESYVQASRAKGATHLYANEIDAGEDLKDLERTMARSHQKDLFHDLPSLHESNTQEHQLEVHR